MTRLWLLVAIALLGCTVPDGGPPPVAGPMSGPAADPPVKLYGRPLALDRETRLIPVPEGTVSALAYALRSEALRGVTQVDLNDCGPAAIATLLGFYDLRAEGDDDPLRAVKLHLPPRQWGTSLEEATGYLNRTGALWAKSYRDGTLEGLMRIVQDGRPVPVVVTLEGSLTRMHWLLVMGLAQAPNGDRYVLCKNPSETDPLAVSPYREADFLQAWDNGPLRSQWWSGLMAGVGETHPDSYRRPYLDVGAVSPL